MSRGVKHYIGQLVCFHCFTVTRHGWRGLAKHTDAHHPGSKALRCCGTTVTDLNAYRSNRQLSCSQTIEGHLFNEAYCCTRCGLAIA